MDTNNLKYVVGKAEVGKPAFIRFFGSVDSCNCQNFIDEFLFLQECVRPSKIVVLINSEGGSVHYGMGVFSVIQGCPIEVDCIIEGLAASMGSVIWAAGDNLYMHDYSLLMIHNPFLCSTGSEDPNDQQIVSAFRNQLEIIYQKRFGLDAEQVKKIMDGGEGVDGTFFTAKDAVKAGILPKGHIIKTSKQVCDDVKERIDGVSDASSLRTIMDAVAQAVDTTQLIDKALSILPKKNTQETNQQILMEENILFNTVAAQLGFQAESTVASVSGRITELLAAEASLADVKAEVEKLTIQYKGKEAEVANLEAALTETKAALKVYQDNEAAEKAKAIEDMVAEAINAGKIEAGAKEDWIKMAEANFDMVKSTLASIAGRDVITEEIATDAANQQAAQEATISEIEARINEVCGDIKPLTF